MSNRITIPATVDMDDLLDILARSVSNEALVKLVIDLDSHVGEWGFTRKIYKHFRAEMKGADDPDMEPVKDMPEPWLDAEIGRLWSNSPELQKDVKSLAAFQRVVKAVERTHGIRTE